MIIRIIIKMNKYVTDLSTLDSFDLTYLSLGGGVQSSCLAEMVANGELHCDLCIFADTGDEPSYVYEQIWYLAGRLQLVGVPLVVVSNGSIVEDAQSGGRFAAVPVFTEIDGRVRRLQRQCTAEYKIVPIERYVRRVLLSRGLARQYVDGRIFVHKTTRVACLLGISTDEVVRVKPSRSGWITNVWPLIELRLSRADCLQYVGSRSLPVPQKSSCRICPFHNDTEWKYMAKNHPSDWQHVVAFDEWLRADGGRLSATAKGDLYLHRRAIPLAEIDFESQPSLFDGCDSGYCFV